jgi:hypothetical protein
VKNSYEVRLCRRDGKLSLLMQAIFASDHDAIESARQLLSRDAPKASILKLESGAPIFLGMN